MSEALKPCPFCGGKGVWFKPGRDIGIECENGFDCPGRAQTDVYDPEHRQTVIDQWNMRADEPPDEPPDEATSRDAERYRWLRENGRCDSKNKGGVSLGSRIQATVAFRFWCEPELLDAALDAAMKEQPK